MNVDIKKAEEPWVVLHLADGSILKARLNIAAVRRLDGVFSQDGNPAYMFDMQAQTHLIPNEALRAKKPLVPNGQPGQFVEDDEGAPQLAPHPNGDSNAHEAAKKLMGGV